MMRKRLLERWAISGTFVLSFIAVPLRAQLTLPTLTVAGKGISNRPLTAAEAEHQVFIRKVEIGEKHSFRVADYPIDSMRHEIEETGRRWLQLIRGNTSGIQLDPSGLVGVAAREEAYAKQQIAKRLNTSGLSFDDRAFTYLTAVQAFTDEYHPERLPDAEAYLKQLRAMGNGAAYWEFQALYSLVETYHRLGRASEVIRHGVRAIALVGVMQFYDRGMMFNNPRLYSALTDALIGQPDGRKRFETLNSMLAEACVPSAADVALDSAYAQLGKSYAFKLQSLILGTSKLGESAPSLVSNYWLNRSTQDSTTIRIDDGKIHIVEVSGYGCPGCIKALQGLERLKHRFSDIEVIMMTCVTGSWGNRQIPAEEEVKHLENFFLNIQKVTFPIGIWMSKKVPTEDGGQVVESAGPAFDHYAPLVKPTLFVVDSKGKIRRMFFGFSRDQEAHAARTIRFLQQEAQGLEQHRAER